MPDYVLLLNDLLQKNPAGNLAHHFSYMMTMEGPEGRAIHIATARFRGEIYGVGRGMTKAAARVSAARVVYEDFMSNGVPEK